MTATVVDTAGPAIDLRETIAPPARRRASVSAEWIGPVAVFAVFVGLWYVVHYWAIEALWHRPRFFVPAPHSVVHDAFLTWNASRANGSLSGAAGGGLHDQLVALWLSARVALLGLAIAIVIGTALAVLMSQARWIERALFPYAVALQAIPILAFVPLIGLLLGFTFRSRVLVCVIIALFPIIANTLLGLSSVDPAHRDLFALHHASRTRTLWKLQVPTALPAFFTGLRISAGLSVVGAVVGDVFFRQGQPGIGQLIDRYGKALSYTQMYGSVILAAALALVVFWGFGWLGDRVAGHWQQQGSARQ